ncbi:unnamed protein product, partial [Discosporangium mesarthrocarpum]
MPDPPTSHVNRADEKARLEDVEQRILVIEAKETKVEEDVSKVEAALGGGASYLGLSVDHNQDQLLERLKSLEDKQKFLCTEKKQLRDKELFLLHLLQQPATGSGTGHIMANENPSLSSRSTPHLETGAPTGQALGPHNQQETLVPPPPRVQIAEEPKHNGEGRTEYTDFSNSTERG